MDSVEKSCLHREDRPVRWTGYVTLVLVILFFSGVFTDVEGPLSCLDFTVLNGSFGKIAEDIGFVGKGGSGARHGFLFALSLVPGIMLALGVVAVAEKLDALRAAQRLLTPLMRPLMGLPGTANISLLFSRAIRAVIEVPLSSLPSTKTVP